MRLFHHKRGFKGRIVTLVKKPYRSLCKRWMRLYLQYKYRVLALNLRKPIGILILDNFEPSGLNLGFRYEEIKFLLGAYHRSVLVHFTPEVICGGDRERLIKDIQWPIGSSMPAFMNNWHSALSAGRWRFRKVYLQRRQIRAKCAYLHFLYNAYLAKNFLEDNGIPFVFTLFPGGGLFLNDAQSDSMLRTVFSSPLFRGCFVPQKVIYDYLIAKGFCEPSKLFFSYGGGFLQFPTVETSEKVFLGKGKSTLDVCFVAFRYMKGGYDKGFDIALKSMCQVIDKNPNVHFHVVGTNTPKDFPEINMSLYRNNIHIYGCQRKDFFVKFYARMDIALSPNRPNTLRYGAFDGFPLMVEASYYGVMLLVANEMNECSPYINGEDLIVIHPDVDDVVEKINCLIKTPSIIPRIAMNGQRKTQKIFSRERQVKMKMAFLKKYLGISGQVGI